MWPRRRSPRVAGDIHDAIKATTGLDVPIITRTVDEWRAIIDANPFPDAAADGKTLHLVVLDGKATAKVKDFDHSKFAPEALGVSRARSTCGSPMASVGANSLLR